MSFQPTDSPTQQSLLGTVIAVQANFYQVRLSSVQPSQELLCIRRAILKKLGQSVMVGDRVLVEEPDWSGGRGAIAQVLPRKTLLSRPPVANANQVLLVFSLAQPRIEPLQLTRFLVTIEQTAMDVIVGLSKVDLVSPSIRDEWHARLSCWGYNSVPISLPTGEGLPALQQLLQSKLTVLSGPSGVGKSSLIRRLVPDSAVRVGTVSKKWHQGRHTTRHVELFDLPQGGLLADTPGFNQPEIKASPTELGLLFPEIQQKLAVQSCQYSDCLHRDEPNCPVQDNWERYEYYQCLLEESLERQGTLNALKDRERKTKSKHRSSGQVVFEPRLEQKKYRRQSRRSRHQSLENEIDSEELYLDELL